MPGNIRDLVIDIKAKCNNKKRSTKNNVLFLDSQKNEV